MSFIRLFEPRDALSGVIAYSDQLRNWLADLPADKPWDAAASIAERVRAIRREHGSVRSRVQLLELVRQPAERFLDPIESSLTGISLPLPDGPQRSYSAADRMLGELSEGYGESARLLATRWVPIGEPRGMRAPVTHAIRLTARKLSLGYRVYLNGADPIWLRLHRLYRLASEAGVSAPPPGLEETPELAYLKALLLALADPTHLAAGELNHVLKYLDRHAHLAEIAPAAALTSVPSEPAYFLVQADQPRAGRSTVKWKPEKLGARDLVLNCTQLVARLDAQIDALENRVAPVKLGLPKAAAEPQYLAMLRSLRSLWGQSPTRRFSRVRFRPRADVIAGFPAVWNFLSEQVKPGIATQAPKTSEWAIRDESPEGFGLRYVDGDTARLRVGELAMVRPRSTQDIKICVVRREAIKRADALDLGVQVFAAQALPAAVAIREAGGAGEGRKEKVILIPHLPAHDAQRGLLVAPDGVATGHRFSFRQDGRRVVLQVGERLERMASCDLFALEQHEA